MLTGEVAGLKSGERDGILEGTCTVFHCILQADTARSFSHLQSTVCPVR